tara:strand:+ start:215 stop:1780 length:1566 start_codon:yes stop_codon:yes gene_type:complete
MIAIAGRRVRRSSSTRFSSSFLSDNNNNNVSHRKDDECDDDGKNRRWICSSSLTSLTSSSTSSKSGGRRGMSSDASPSPSSSSSSDSSNSNSKSSSTRNEREKDDDDDDDATKKEKKKDGFEGGAKSTTSAKAQDLLNAFRKQREKLQSDPRVKEAFSEAKKFKEEMKREVGMERMFGKGGGAKSASGASEEKEASPESSSSDSSSSNSASSSASASTSFIGRYFNVALDAIREEVRLLNMDETEQFKEKRKKQREKEMRDYAAAAAGGGDGDAPASTAVQIVKPKDPTRFERMFEDVKQKLGFSEENLDKLQQSEAVKKLKNVQEDLRERWETSDSPMVHRIQDASESFFGETDQAEAMKLIRQMDVGFNTSDFLSEVKSTVPDVIKSYLLGDVESLKKMENISPEIIERMDGQINAWKSLGHVVDARLLHVSELELVEIRVLDNSPTVVLQFACQQVNCVRDAKTKEIIEGANDDIQSVHYLWAMQLSDVEFETEDGRKFSKPTWQLREMVLRGMMSIT